jgi:hypothetical protein
MVILLDDLRRLLHVLHSQPASSPLIDLTQAMSCCGVVPPRMQYYNVVREQDRMLQSGAQSEALWSFWQRSLAEPLPVLQLPTDRPRPPIQTYQGAAFNLHVPKVKFPKH